MYHNNIISMYTVLYYIIKVISFTTVTLTITITIINTTLLIRKLYFHLPADMITRSQTWEITVSFSEGL